MRALKLVVVVVGGLLPIAYCGYLLHYFFFDVSGGSMEEAKTIGLGPTVLGLAVVGSLFCFALIVRIVWIFAAPRSPGSLSSISGGRRGPDASASSGESDSDFDADAVVARYMAGRSAEVARETRPMPSGREHTEPAARPTFGRRTK